MAALQLPSSGPPQTGAWRAQAVRVCPDHASADSRSGREDKRKAFFLEVVARGGEAGGEAGRERKQACTRDRVHFLAVRSPSDTLECAVPVQREHDSRLGSTRVLVDLASTRPEIVTIRNAIVLGQVLVRVLVVS